VGTVSIPGTLKGGVNRFLPSRDYIRMNLKGTNGAHAPMEEKTSSAPRWLDYRIIGPRPSAA
jgi:hypothetical protein